MNDDFGIVKGRDGLLYRVDNKTGYVSEWKPKPPTLSETLSDIDDKLGRIVDALEKLYNIGNILSSNVEDIKWELKK